MTCTYLGCGAEGLYPQIATDGEVWATLCLEHCKELDKSIQEVPFNPVSALSTWVKAQGGAKKAAERIS